MIVIICVAAVVALLSLYDFFSNRSWQGITSAARNNTVFANRNRAYGAYDMRRNYDKRVMLILAAMVGGTGVFYAATRKAKAEDVVIRPKKEIVIEYILPDKEEEEIQREMPTAPVQNAGAEQVFNELRVSDTEPDPGIAPADPSIVVGPVVGPGDPFAPVGPPVVIGDPIVEPVTPTPPSGPEIYVDEPAEFPGGRPALLNYLGNNMRYPQLEAELGIEGKCYLQFVVSKIGDISRVTIQRGVPDCEACDKEAVRVVKTMPNWKPAKKNGKTVDSYFNLPVTFELQ